MVLLRQESNPVAMDRHNKANHRHDELILFALLSAPIAISYPELLVRYTMYALGALALLIFTLILYCFSFPAAREIQAMRAETFQAEKVPEDLDTIVIGSGSGGSTCANLLAQSGQKVLVLEQHPTVTGGCTHSFREQNCEWDTGLHYTSKDMSKPTARPGSIMNFMSRGAQEWTPLKDPYESIREKHPSMSTIESFQVAINSMFNKDDGVGDN